MYGNMFDGLFKVIFVVGLLAGGAIVAICFFFIPWLWDVLKPWLHAITQ